MRRLDSRWLWRTVALIALSLPATLPFWQPNFIFTADSPAHLWRVYELDRALHQGILYPRWAPDLVFGYGYPVFNFYAPLSFYLTEFLHMLGLDLADAMKAFFSLCVPIAALGAFLLGRDFYSPYLEEAWQQDAAGWVTAAAFVYSPYLLLDIYVRGAIGETLAMAVLPFYLWSLRRLFSTPTVANALTWSAFGALLLLSHNVVFIFAVPILGVFFLVRFLTFPSPRTRVRALVLAGGASIVSLTLSAFYWLPVALELPFIYIGNPAQGRSALLQALLAHLQPLNQLVQLKWIYEYPEGPFPLGLALVALALVGFSFGLFWLKRQDRLELAYWALVVVIIAFALSEPSRPFWLALPALWTVEFAWRLTIFIVLGAALATGAWVILAARLIRRRWAIVITALVVIINLVGTGMLNMHPGARVAPSPTDMDPATLARYEVNVGAVGTSSMFEYLPTWAKIVPLIKPLKSPRPTEEDAESSPEINIKSVQPGDWQFTVNSPTPVSLPFRIFYYPDWHGWIDGQPALLRPSSQVGLLTIDLPAGRHNVRLAHASLPARDVGMTLALLTLLGFGGWLVLQIRHNDSHLKTPAVIVTATFLIFAIPQVQTIGASSPRFKPLQIDVDDTLRVVGLATEDSSSSVLKLHVIWQVKRPITEDVPTRIQLTDDVGQVWVARVQMPRYGTGGTQYWVQNEIVEDQYELFLPTHPPGEQFNLQIARGGRPGVFVTRLTLNSASELNPPPLIAHPVDARFGDSIRLLGFDSPPGSLVQPGDSLPLTLFWRAEQDILEDYTVFVQLLDSDGKLVAQADSLPKDGFAPTMLWHPGEIIADPHVLRLPASLSPGVYQIIAGLYRFRNLQTLPVATSAGSSDDDFVTLTSVKVSADVPFTPEHNLDVRLGTNIQLLGFTLHAVDSRATIAARATGTRPVQLTTRANTSVQLTVRWHVESAVHEEYQVFVHLVDAKGDLIRQQDSPPVGGHYGTSLWAPGESIVDSYALPLGDLPTGQYQLLIGMYSPDTLERLPALAPDGSGLPDREILLARIDITP